MVCAKYVGKFSSPLLILPMGTSAQNPRVESVEYTRFSAMFLFIEPIDREYTFAKNDRQPADNDTSLEECALSHEDV